MPYGCGGVETKLAARPRGADERDGMGCSGDRDPQLADQLLSDNRDSGVSTDPPRTLDRATRRISGMRPL